jgi:aerobic-type carbon monoxide dehydrogenase small subunit (CoxS/CutS family)
MKKVQIEPKTVNFKLNGRPVSVMVQTHHTLVQVLQEQLGMFGARESCGQGLCGCCTVSVNDTPVSGCLYLAVRVDGADVRTVEGMADEEGLSPVQQSFIDESAFQCGFCTSGFIMMADKMLREERDITEDSVREYLSGNLCRCGTYPEVVSAVLSAAEKLSRV